jgi:hypothetical protein
MWQIPWYSKIINADDPKDHVLTAEKQATSPRIAAATYQPTSTTWTQSMKTCNTYLSQTSLHAPM